MKKIMLVLALIMSVGLFANASNSMVKKVGLPKTEKKPTYWIVQYGYGPNNIVGEVCCFATYAQAYAYAMDHPTWGSTGAA